MKFLKPRDKEKLLSQLERLEELLDDHTENFIAERPFLWKGEAFDCENLEERQKENEIKLKSTAKIISEELAKNISKETQKGEQTAISGIS